MKRLARRLFTLRSAISLVLCLAPRAVVPVVAVFGCGPHADADFGQPIPDWVRPGVKFGQGYISKLRLADDERLHAARDLRPITRLPNGPGGGFAVTGSGGMLVFDRGWGAVAWQPLPTGEGVGTGFHLVDIDGRGSHILFREAMVGVDPGVFSMDGTPLWSISRHDQFFSDWASADLDGDGLREFVLAFTTEIVALKADGSLLWVWRTPRRGSGVFAEVAVADAVSGGQPEIIAAIGGDLLTLDARGNMISRSTPDVRGFFATFAVVRWATDHGEEGLLAAEDNSFVLLSLDGRKRLAVFAPRSGLDPRAAAVKLRATDPPSLVVLSGVMHQGRENPGFEQFNTALSIYDWVGDLKYREVLEGSNAALLVVPDEEKGHDSFVVAAGSEIWRYSAAPEAREPGGQQDAAVRKTPPQAARTGG